MVDTKICPRCGGLMIRTGTCHTCTHCGDSSGCGRTHRQVRRIDLRIALIAVSLALGILVDCLGH